MSEKLQGGKLGEMTTVTYPREIGLTYSQLSQFTPPTLGTIRYKRADISDGLLYALERQQSVLAAFASEVDWGSSNLSADTIKGMNEIGMIVSKAIAMAKGSKMKFKIGDRVRLKYPQSWTLPYRKWALAGRVATVSNVFTPAGSSCESVRIEFDGRKNTHSILYVQHDNLEAAD